MGVASLGSAIFRCRSVSLVRRSCLTSSRAISIGVSGGARLPVLSHSHSEAPLNALLIGM